MTERGAVPFGDSKIAYSIVRSARRHKTVELTIARPGEVVVAAPVRTSVERIEAHPDQVGIRAGRIRRRTGRGKNVDQLLHAGGAPPRGHDQRAVLEEGAGITEIGDVLTGRALVGTPPAGHGIRPVLVEGLCLTGKDFRKVRADLVKIDLLRLLDGGADGLVRLDEDQRMAFEDGITLADS